jgi:hypothetical protein
LNIRQFFPPLFNHTKVFTILEKPFTASSTYHATSLCSSLLDFLNTWSIYTCFSAKKNHGADRMKIWRQSALYACNRNTTINPFVQLMYGNKLKMKLYIYCTNCKKKENMEAKQE